MFNFNEDKRLTKTQALIVTILAFIVVMYMGITTVVLWFHAGLIWKFLAANLLLFIANKLMIVTNDHMQKENKTFKD